MTAYGIDAIDQKVYTVDLTDGSWDTGVSFIPAVSGQALAYDCDAGVLYMVDQNGQLYTLDPVSGTASALFAPQLPDARGLAYDSLHNLMFACRTLTSTEVLDTTTGLYSIFGATGLSPPFVPQALVYDCVNNKLYGVATDSTNFQTQMYTVNNDPLDLPNKGKWTAFTGDAGIDPTVDGVARGMLWNQADGNFYGVVTTDPPGSGGQMYGIDISLGSWNPPGPLTMQTGTAFPQNMAFVRPCCCVLESTLVSMADGSTVPISEVKAGDVVMDFRGRQVAVRQNVCSGRRNEFVKVAANSLGQGVPNADLFIRREHEVLLQDKVIPCQYLPLSQEVELEQRGGVFTLVTEDKTFVRMQGMNIATWSEAAFQEFLQNNPTGRQLHYKSQ